MLFRIDRDGKAAEAASPDSFSELPYHERYDIQEWVLNNPELLGEPLLVVTSEFSGFDRTSERLDVLALDRNGRLVVVELKRTATGTTAELQALRYAAYCSTLELDDVAEMRLAYLRRREQSAAAEDVREEIEAFVDAPEFEELDDKPRIILAADDFGPEITSTVLWLRSFGIDIQCVRLTPYTVGDDLVVDSTVLIPLPEAEEYVVRREKKEASRSAREPRRRPSLDEFVEGVPESVREHFLRMREALVSRPGVKETVFQGLISYRREEDNAWISWLTHTRTQARFALPDTQDVPDEMVVKSRSGWTTLRVATEEEASTAVELLVERLARVEEEGGPRVLGEIR